MRKLFNLIIISFVLAISEVDSSKLKNKKVAPVILEVDYTPIYMRKRPLKKPLRFSSL